MTYEALDETIDRVATDLTTVAADPTLSARVQERLHKRRGQWLMPALAAASVAAVIVAVVLMPRPNDRVQPRALNELSAANLTAFDTLRGTVASSATASRVGRIAAPVDGLYSGEGRWEGPSRAAAAVMTNDVAPQDAAEPLAVAALSVPPLADPGLVEIMPLDIAPLEVLRLDVTDELKEPQ